MTCPRCEQETDWLCWEYVGLSGREVWQECVDDGPAMYDEFAVCLRCLNETWSRRSTPSTWIEQPPEQVVS